MSCTFELVAGVTSLALTADGSYVVAGATDGTVRLFSMVLGTNDRHGTLLGQIPAKGLHTVLHVHVCVTEDCRIAFAGASRGSALMMAFDLSRLPTWASSRKRRGPLQTFVRSHTHNDAKLKGFCEATRLLPSVAGESGAAAEYRLLCGRGIKNVHVWAFDLADDGHVEWRLLHDLQTNGMRVELKGFRTVGVGVRVYSKSCAQCIRLWDVEGDGKPRFVDVENTADARRRARRIRVRRRRAAEPRAHRRRGVGEPHRARAPRAVRRQSPQPPVHACHQVARGHAGCAGRRGRVLRRQRLSLGPLVELRAQGSRRHAARFGGWRYDGHALVNAPHARAAHSVLGRTRPLGLGNASRAPVGAARNGRESRGEFLGHVVHSLLADR